MPNHHISSWVILNFKDQNNHMLRSAPSCLTTKPQFTRQQTPGLQIMENYCFVNTMKLGTANLLWENIFLKVLKASESAFFCTFPNLYMAQSVTNAARDKTCVGFSWVTDTYNKKVYLNHKNILDQ